MTITISLTINGRHIKDTVDPALLLVDFLRENCQLTGTHVGCDTSQCGACTVLFDDQAIKACTLFAAQADGASIVTIEGLAQDDELHPMQNAFQDHHGLQCGFCTPGMVLTAIDIARTHGAPDDATIRRELEGNLCRCTGYQNIVKAVSAGARAMSKD